MAGRPDLGIMRGLGSATAGFDPRGASPMAYQYGMAFPTYMPVLPAPPPPPPPTQPPPVVAAPPPPPPPTNQPSAQSPQSSQLTPSEYAFQKWQSLQQNRGGQPPQMGNQNWRPSLDFAGSMQRKPRLDGKARFNAYKRTRPEFNSDPSPNFANTTGNSNVMSSQMSAADGSRSDMSFTGGMTMQGSSAGISDKQGSSVNLAARGNGSTGQFVEVASSVNGSDASQRKQNKIGFRTRWNNEEQMAAASATAANAVESNVQTNRPFFSQYSNVAGGQNAALMKPSAAGFPVRAAFTKNVADLAQSKQAVGGMIRGSAGKWSSIDNANANAWQNRSNPANARSISEVEPVSTTSSSSNAGGSGLGMNVSDLPESLRRFVARALDSVARADHEAMLAVLHRRLREAIISKRASEVNWDAERIPILPRSNTSAVRPRSRSRSHSHSSSSSRSRSQSSSSSRSRSRSRSESDDDSSRRKRKKRKSEDNDGSRSKRMKKNRKEQKRKEELKRQRKRRSSRNDDADYDDDRERSQSEDGDDLSSSRGSRARMHISPGKAKSPPLAGGRLSKAAQRRAKAAAAGGGRITAGVVQDQAMLNKRAARFAAHLAADGVHSRLGAATGNGKKRQAGRVGLAGTRSGHFGPGQNDASQSLLAGLSFSVPFGEDGEDSLDALFAQKRIVGTSQALEKQYLRLTAPPEPSTVRPLSVLRRSAAMLAARWRVDKSAASAAHICEQLKSIRQDLTVQCIRNSFTVKIYEMHARICLEVGHREEFNQCQSQLKQLYDDGIVYEERSDAEDNDEDNRSEHAASASDERSKLRGNQLEFLAYRILYCLFTNQLRNLTQLMSTLSRMRLDRLVGIEINVTATGCGSSAYVRATEQERCLRFALEVRRAYMIGSWSRIFALYADAPRNTRYLLEWLFEQRLRRIALTHIQKAFRPDVPLEWFASQVCLSDKTACLEFLKENQASISDEALVCTKMK